MDVNGIYKLQSLAYLSTFVTAVEVVIEMGKFLGGIYTKGRL